MSQMRIGVPAGRAPRRPAGAALPSPLPLLASLLLAGLVAGCRAERTLAVTSAPSGARILLDDQVIGETPMRHEFHHYGVRRVCVSKEGHRTCSELIELKAPWYGRFPFDIVSEVLLPIGWTDRRHIEIALPEGEEEFSIPGIQSVIERARVLRNAGPTGPGELPPIQPRLLPRMPVDPLGDALEGPAGTDAQGDRVRR